MTIDYRTPKYSWDECEIIHLIIFHCFHPQNLSCMPYQEQKRTYVFSLRENNEEKWAEHLF